MEITNIESFLQYYERIRYRTIRVINCIPIDKMEWSPIPQKMSFREIIIHIATIERYMYAETIQGNKSSYPGYKKEEVNVIEPPIEYMNRLNKESCDIFSKLSPQNLLEKCLTPLGTEITIWKWLRALIEHEIHHRGHIYANLGYLEIKTPPLYGMTSEEVADKNL